MAMNIGEADGGMVAADVPTAAEEAELIAVAGEPDQMLVPHAKSIAALELLAVHIDSVPAVSDSSAHNNGPSQGLDHCWCLSLEPLAKGPVWPVDFGEQLVPG